MIDGFPHMVRVQGQIVSLGDSDTAVSQQLAYRVDVDTLCSQMTGKGRLTLADELVTMSTEPHVGLSRATRFQVSKAWHEPLPPFVLGAAPSDYACGEANRKNGGHRARWCRQRNAHRRMRVLACLRSYSGQRERIGSLRRRRDFLAHLGEIHHEP